MRLEAAEAVVEALDTSTVSLGNRCEADTIGAVVDLFVDPGVHSFDFVLEVGRKQVYCWRRVGWYDGLESCIERANNLAALLLTMVSIPRVEFCGVGIRAGCILLVFLSNNTGTEAMPFAKQPGWCFS